MRIGYHPEPFWWNWLAGLYTRVHDRLLELAEGIHDRLPRD